MFKSIVLVLLVIVLNITATDTDVGIELTKKILEAKKQLETINVEVKRMSRNFNTLKCKAFYNYDVQNFNKEQRFLEKRLAIVLAKTKEALKIEGKFDEIRKACESGVITKEIFDTYKDVTTKLRTKFKNVNDFEIIFDWFFKYGKEIREESSLTRSY